MGARPSARSRRLPALPPTLVYATFGTKARVLTALIEAGSPQRDEPSRTAGGAGGPGRAGPAPQAPAVRPRRREHLGPGPAHTFAILRAPAALEPEMVSIYAEMWPPSLQGRRTPTRVDLLWPPCL